MRWKSECRDRKRYGNTVIIISSDSTKSKLPSASDDALIVQYFYDASREGSERSQSLDIGSIISYSSEEEEEYSDEVAEEESVESEVANVLRKGRTTRTRTTPQIFARR